MITTPIDGGITAPKGFQAGTAHCGLKRRGPDLALIVADAVSSAAAVFTTNRVIAAPIIVCKEHLQRGSQRVRAIAVNSGCANACTGEAGLVAARQMATTAATAVGCHLHETLIASTGVIGLALDVSKISQGIASAALALGRETHSDAAKAIMTTDPWPKETAVQVMTPSGPFSVGGMAKGAGMIEPNMATMLAFLTTDAQVDPRQLQQALVTATHETFNAITVDGERSTNDSVFLLASGASGVAIDEASYPFLVDGLRVVCRHLAREIVRGGEGATKLVAVHVTGARSPEEARRAARAIANSLLVKTALHGGDPNWGRLVAVAGRADVAVELGRMRVQIGPAVLFENNTVYADREAEAATHLSGAEVEVKVDLGTGGVHEDTIWTCDLSAEYVRINADYRT